MFIHIYIYTHIRCALRTPNLSMAPDSSLGDWPANGFGFLSGLRVQGFGGSEGFWFREFRALANPL